MEKRVDILESSNLKCVTAELGGWEALNDLSVLSLQFLAVQ